MSKLKMFSPEKKCYVTAMHKNYLHTSPDYVLVSVMVLTFASTCAAHKTERAVYHKTYTPKDYKNKYYCAKNYVSQ